MTKLEESNINTQVSLMREIISNYRHICYSVTDVGKKMKELLAKKKYDEAEKLCTFTKEDFDKLLDMVYILQDEENFNKLGILAQSAVPDNEIKLKILNQLQA